MKTADKKIIIIKKPTRLDYLIKRFNTKSQARFYIEHLNADFSDYENENDTYRMALDKVMKSVETIGHYQVIDWTQVSSFIFGDDDIIVTIGQDGLVANTLKYLKSQVIIGFNSDYKRWDGILAQFKPDESKETIEAYLQNKLFIREVTKGMVQLSDSQVLYAVNDFFIGVKDHGSAKYEINYNGQREDQSSSGIIVSMPLGRSGWLRSVLTGASNIVNRISDKKIAIRNATANNWNEDCMYFAVREPFPSISSGSDIVFGKVSDRKSLKIESRMGQDGVIFSDGIQTDYLSFNYSVTALFGLAPEKGHVVVRNE